MKKKFDSTIHNAHFDLFKCLLNLIFSNLSFRPKTAFRFSNAKIRNKIPPFKQAQQASTNGFI